VTDTLAANNAPTPPLQGRDKGWGLAKAQVATLHDRAHAMRREPTEPEKRLWRALSNRQLAGLKFRRQAAIGTWIADFACPAARLIVEVDGDTHDAEADARRDAALVTRGWRTVRVSNADVMTNIDGVLQHILAASAPHPNPSPEGEGLE
jgi:very-short-patch-repair endonuclease